ncbi:MAG: glycine betaine ABC transporter substrate-binding protein [Cyanobacteria bacterium P01_G01_bin.38]
MSLKDFTQRAALGILGIALAASSSALPSMASVDATEIAQQESLAQSTVTVARLPLSMYDINSAFVEIIAEAKGFEVEYLDGLHAALFPALAEGEADILTSIWLPYGHRTYWEEHGDNYITIGTIFQNGISYFAVPDYVDHTIQSVNDLARPEIAEQFSSTIPTIHVGTSMYEKSAQIVEDYGLDAVGFQVEPGDSASWEAALETAIANEEWIVFPLWEPQFLNRAYNLRPLVEPQGIFGGRESTFLVANADWAREADPALITSLSRINVSLQDLNELDYQVNVEGLSARAAVEAYFAERPGLLEEWIR